jgi:probable HAF family extracellular repeat protein
MLHILNRMNLLFGHDRLPAVRKGRNRAQQPWVVPLEVRALLASFQGLGAGTDAAAVSADGSAVVGNVSTGSQPGPFYWTPQSDGPVFLRDSSGDIYPGIAAAVSGGGSVIVGNPYSGGGGQAFSWADGVAAPIPQLASGGTANSVSQDGSIIAGSVNGTGYELTGSMLQLIPPPSANIGVANVTAISANGSVLVGNFFGPAAGSAFQWNNGTFMPFSDTTAKSSDATAVSGDGSVVVGWLNNGSGIDQAFQWANGNVVTPSSLPSGFTVSVATGVSNSGTTTVGYMTTNGISAQSEAFIWTQANGVQNLQQVLTADDGLGPQLAGWTLTEATAITPDGNTIVGNGVDPQGQQEGWIVNLGSTSPPPPHQPQSPPPITWANPADIVFGTTLGAAQLDASDSVPGTFTYSPPPGTLLHAGAGQSLTVTFTPTDTADYSTATKAVTINVLQATPTITWPNPADIVSGTPLGASQLDATASATVGGQSVSVPGVFAYSPPAGTVLMLGNNQALSVTFTPTDPIDYTGAMAAATINVVPSTGPTGGAHHTRTTLTAKPRPATFGRPVTLTASVKSLGHGRGTPTGEVIFMNGLTILGAADLSHGTAVLSTSSLPLGRDVIAADYVGTETFTPSTARIVEKVRPPRSKAKITAALGIRRSARGISRAAMSRRAEGSGAELVAKS